MPRQSSIQLTRATERQVEALKRAGYGRLSDIVRISVHLFYKAELEVLEGKLHTVARIEVEYSEDGLFGADGPEGYDLRASFDEFERLLEEALRSAYPEAEISIRNGRDFHKALDADGLEIDTETEAVDGIVYAVHSGDEWLVRN